MSAAALFEVPEPGPNAKKTKAVAVKLGLLRVRAAVLTGVCDELFSWCVFTFYVCLPCMCSLVISFPLVFGLVLSCFWSE